MRETLIVILNECEGSITVVRKAGMRIKAISCELSAIRWRIEDMSAVR